MNAAESLPTTLDRTDQRWAVALEAAGDGVWDWCVPQNQVFCSRRWKEMLGYGEDELGDSFEEWESRIHRDDLPDYYRRLKRHIDGEMPVFSSEHRMRCRDGSYRWFLDRGMVISRGDNGQPVRVIGTHSDITESRLAKDALKSSQQKLRTIIDIALDAVVQMDAAGIITDWNIQAEKVFGWSKQEAIGRLLHETIIPTQYREAHVAGLAQCLATGQGALLNTRVETLALHRRGHTFPVELAISPLLIDGKYEFSSFIRDITDRKQAEAAIKLSDSVYKAIGEAIMIADTSNRIVAVNPVFTEVTGYSEEEVIGKAPAC
ncbi:PAS domain-containing protein [Methylogaea oryzae]|uniref:PAS domain-containing protein n=1 Tax=Methylogaea oryzae TaxID=1295382 RepID=UPI0006D2A4F4|nr:PAS domain S-box protein [Methylogaea oryzae]